MKQLLVYGDSLTWGIVPGTRQRLAPSQRWPVILESELNRRGHAVRIVEDCLNGRRTVWDDPFKAGRNGIAGIEQRIEVNSPLALVIVMLGTNDFQSVHQHNAWQSSQGIAAIVRAIRRAPIEPDMPVPPVLIVAPPRPKVPSGTMVEKFEQARERSQGLADAYRAVAAELSCGFFDADTIIAASPVDGVHLDADEHAKLGREIVSAVIKLL
jgi:lysophospholipase L1-like esterase